MTITTFTTDLNDLTETAQKLHERLDGQSYFNFRVSAGYEMANGFIELEADCEADRREEALEMAFAILAQSI